MPSRSPWYASGVGMSLLPGLAPTLVPAGAGPTTTGAPDDGTLQPARPRAAAATRAITRSRRVDSGISVLLGFGVGLARRARFQGCRAVHVVDHRGQFGFADRVRVEQVDVGR